MTPSSKLYYSPLRFKVLGPQGGFEVRIQYVGDAYEVTDDSGNEDTHFAHASEFNTFSEALANAQERLASLADFLIDELPTHA